MLDQQRFTEVTKTLVVEHFPDEVLVFEIRGDAMITELFDTGVVAAKPVSAELGFVDPSAAKQVLEVVTFLNVIYKILKQLSPFVERSKTATIPVIEQRLRDDLIAQGMPPEKAASIATQYSREFEGLL